MFSQMTDQSPWGWVKLPTTCTNVFRRTRHLCSSLIPSWRRTALDTPQMSSSWSLNEIGMDSSFPRNQLSALKYWIKQYRELLLSVCFTNGADSPVDHWSWDRPRSLPGNDETIAENFQYCELFISRHSILKREWTLASLNSDVLYQISHSRRCQ